MLICLRYSNSPRNQTVITAIPKSVVIDRKTGKWRDTADGFIGKIGQKRSFTGHLGGRKIIGVYDARRLSHLKKMLAFAQQTETDLSGSK